MFGRETDHSDPQQEGTTTLAEVSDREADLQAPSQPSGGTVSIWQISSNSGPAVPHIGDEDSAIDFRAAFDGVIDLERGEPSVGRGEPIPDPLEQLSPDERAEYRDELEDVIKAQRYGQSLGFVSRR